MSRKDAESLEHENEQLRAEIAELRRRAADTQTRLDALRESEEKYRRLHESRIDAYASVSMDGRIQESNDLFRQMVGYEAEELRQLTYRDLTPEKWHAFEEDILETQILVRGHSDIYEKEYRRKDGTIFPVELRSVLLRDRATDRPTGVWAMVRDITDRKVAERALAESEEKFKTAFLTSVDAFYIGTLADGRILEINRAFEDLFGYPREAAVGRTSQELGLWADYGDRLAMRERLLAAGFVKEMATTGRRRSGELFPCSISTTALRMQGRHCVVGVVRDESERRHAEQALIESREALAEAKDELLALINSTDDLIGSVDAETFGLLTFNAGLRAYFANRGLDLREGMTPSDMLPPDLAERWRALYTRALRDGPFTEQYTTVGGVPILLLSLNLVRRAGRVQAISVFGRDITERMRAENALRESERRFRTLIEDAPIAVRLNRGEHVIYANSPYLALYRYEDMNPLVGTRVVEQWAPECREEVRQYLCGAARSHAAFDYEGTALRRDGTRFAAHAAISPVQLPDGPAIIAYITDITDRKRAEKSLMASEERFRQVAETVCDFIWEVDADGLYTYTNAAVERILGYRPDELVGRLHFYDLFAENVREELKTAAFDAFATRQPFRAFPNPNISKDGRLVHLETSGAPMLDEDGNLLGYRGADSDVTARWLSEQAIRDLTGKVIDAQEAERSRLARELHDDFSQRLAILEIGLDLLRRSPPSTERALREAVDDLHAQVHSLGTDIRRMSHDLHPARLEQLGLAAAVRGLCNDLSGSHQVEIRCETDSVPRDVPATVGLCLYRVTQEALQNVVKHSGAATAVVELRGCDGEIHLVVRDDGCGFDEAAVERAETLGLANMRERVRSISGRLAIRSIPGEGTSIDVQAPLGESGDTGRS